MRHPFDFIPNERRKPLFFKFLVLTLVLFAVLRSLDQPLRTTAAPNGIVSFELAGIPDNALVIVRSWEERSLLDFPEPLDGFSNVAPNVAPNVYAAFGLGFDYLFMLVYASALALATLLAAGKHSGWMKSFGAVAGWGVIGAAMFDAVENFALWRVLLGDVVSPYPEIAAVCASIKFFLISFGGLYAITGWLIPRQSHI